MCAGVGQKRILNLRRLCPSLCESGAGKEENCMDEWLSSDKEIKEVKKLCQADECGEQCR